MRSSLGELFVALQFFTTLTGITDMVEDVELVGTQFRMAESTPFAVYFEGVGVALSAVGTS